MTMTDKSIAATKTPAALNANPGCIIRLRLVSAPNIKTMKHAMSPSKTSMMFPLRRMGEVAATEADGEANRLFLRI